VVSVYRTVPDDRRREWGRKHTCPIKAMVRPANAPPLNTRAAAIPRYSHRPGSLPVLGGSLERVIKGEDGEWIVGAAESRGSWHRARKITLARLRTAGRKARYRFPAGVAITIRREGEDAERSALLGGHGLYMIVM